MVNNARDVILGVVKKLNILDLPVYTDTVKSNLQNPCFIVLTVEYNHRKLPSNRYVDFVPLQVVYIPSDDDNGVNLEMSEIVTRLNRLLEVIEVEEGVMVRGFNMNSETLENTLYYNVDYRVVMRDVNLKSKMSELSVDSEVVD